MCPRLFTVEFVFVFMDVCDVIDWMIIALILHSRMLSVYSSVIFIILSFISVRKPSNGKRQTRQSREIISTKPMFMFLPVFSSKSTCSCLVNVCIFHLAKCANKNDVCYVFRMHMFMFVCVGVWVCVCVCDCLCVYVVNISYLKKIVKFHCLFIILFVCFSLVAASLDIFQKKFTMLIIIIL